MGTNEQCMPLDVILRRNDICHEAFWLDMHDLNLIKQTQTERQSMKLDCISKTCQCHRKRKAV